MKLKDLIQELQKYDPEKEICVKSDAGYIEEILEIGETRLHHKGDIVILKTN